jgi:autotransporter-associated beta strand protein
MNHYNFFGRSVAMGMMIIMVSQGAQAAVTNRTWIGSAYSTNINSSGNWDTLPVTGNAWTFGSTNGTQGTTLNNDFTGYTVAGITFSAGALPWTINGNTITNTGNITVVDASTNQKLNIFVANVGNNTNTVNGSSVLTIDTIRLNGSDAFRKNGSGALILSTGITYGSGGKAGLYLDAGKLTMNASIPGGSYRVYIGNGSTLDTENPNGVTYTTSSDNFITIGGDFAFLGSGGDLTLNSAVSSEPSFLLSSNSTITVSARVLTLSGAKLMVGGAVGITKEGAGTLVLNVASTNSGPIAVNNGRLNMVGTATNAAMSVASGATLGGEGAVASLVLSNANFFIDGSTSNALTCVTNTTSTGNLNLSGTTTVYLDALPATTGMVIRVLNYYGALTGGTNNLALGDAVNYRAFAFSTATVNQVNLDVGAKALLWSGASAAWDIGNSTNWNSGADKYYDGDVVAFTNSGSQSVTLAATVRPGAVTFNNASGTNYTLSGAGGIAGIAGLFKNGRGTLTIANSNTYSGVTAVSAGTLVLSGSLSNTAITNSTGVIFTQTVSGVIAGSSSFTSSGTNTLTGTNTYTGATLVYKVGSVLTIAGAGVISNTAALTVGGSGGSTGLGILNYYSSAASMVGAIIVGNGAGCPGILNQTNGAIQGASLRLSAAASSSSGHPGTVNLIGGAMTISGSIEICGQSKDDNPLNTFTISGFAVLNANGGLNMTSASKIDGYYQNGKFIQNGGTVNVAGGLNLVANNTTTNMNHLGEYNLNGGTLNVNSITNQSSGTYASSCLGTFLFNGGTLKPTASNSFFWPNSAYTTASVTNGGAIIDTIGYNITIAQPLVNAAGSTNASLIKLGAGTLTLAGANTYNGATIVSNGVLAVAATGNLGNSAANTLSLITGAQLNLGTAVTARFFRVDGVLMAQGSWGSTSSSAAHQNNSYFSGSGMLTVLEQGSALGAMIRIH